VDELQDTFLSSSSVSTLATIDLRIAARIFGSCAILSNGLGASKNAVRGALAKAFRLPLGQAVCDAAGRGKPNSMRSHQQQVRYQICIHARPGADARTRLRLKGEGFGQLVATADFFK
jgi:hypothetical protein